MFFRDRYHPAPHPHLVEDEVFEQAQEILTARSEDNSKRAGSGSDYLLAGLVRCTKCGARFVGGAAQGSKYRYRYYASFTRHRYGTSTCDAERLPAEQLDEAVLERLLENPRRHRPSDQGRR